MTQMTARHRIDSITAIALVPFISFLSRRPSLSRADAIEVALVLLLEVRMLLSVFNVMPLTDFEASQRGALTVMATLVAFNVIVTLIPELRARL